MNGKSTLDPKSLTSPQALAEINALFQESLPIAGGDPVRAWKNVRLLNPQLFEKLVEEPAEDDAQDAGQAALANEKKKTLKEYRDAFDAELAATGQDPVAAHRNVMRLPKYCALAQKLIPKKSQPK